MLCVDIDGRPVVITTARAAYMIAREAGVPAFVGGELTAIELGVRADRVTYRQAAEWCARKREQAAWRLDDRAACGDVWPEHALRAGEYGLPLGDVLRACGWSLVWWGTGDDAPPLATLTAQIALNERATT